MENKYFTGIVEEVREEQGYKKFKTIHIIIKAEDIEIKGETGRMHDYIHTPSFFEIDEGSNADKYLSQVEKLIPQARDKNNLLEALKLMVGKRFKFEIKMLGAWKKDFQLRFFNFPIELK